MPAIVRSREDALAFALSYRDVGGPPAPWWPTGISSYDDCAAFVSFCLFGLNGQSPFQTYVSGVIERSGLGYRDYSSGIQRGDAAGFNWSGADPHNYDHIGLVLEVAADSVITVEANAAGDAVNTFRRPRSFISGYGRPGYPGSNSAGNGSSPFPDDKEQDMEFRYFHQVNVDPANPGQALILSGPFTDRVITNPDYQARMPKLFGQPEPIDEHDWNVYSQQKAAERAGFIALVDKALDPDQATLLAAIRSIQGGSTGGGTPDVTALAQALVKLLPAVLTKADLTAALDKVPQAVRDEIIKPD